MSDVPSDSTPLVKGGQFEFDVNETNEERFPGDEEETLIRLFRTPRMGRTKLSRDISDGLARISGISRTSPHLMRSTVTMTRRSSFSNRITAVSPPKGFSSRPVELAGRGGWLARVVVAPVNAAPAHPSVRRDRISSRARTEWPRAVPSCHSFEQRGVLSADRSVVPAAAHVRLLTTVENR